MKLLMSMIVFGALAACVTSGSGSYMTNDSYRSTATIDAGVVINGVTLSAAQEDELEVLIGERLPAGRYYVTQDGMMGIEGQPARVNIAAVIQARHGNSDGGGGGGGASGGGGGSHPARGSTHNSS